MASLKWGTPSAAANVFTTALDSLADAARVLSAEIDNDTNQHLYADFELAVRYTTSAPTAGVATAEIYILPKFDTTYPEGSTTVTPQVALLAGVMESRNGSTSANETLHLKGCDIPPGDFKVLLINKSGKTYHSSANVLRIRTYGLQSA